MSRVVIISGYFNPLHVGHLDYIESAKKLGDSLIVIVNNEAQVELKGSVPFMTEEDRLRIVKIMTTKEHFQKMFVTLGWALTGATITTLVFCMYKFIWRVV
jgi:cytidyltransferase-like protein